MRDRQNGRFLKKSEEEIKEIINKKFTNFEYIGDYSGSEGYLKLRCRQCGNIIIKNSQILRPSRNKKLCCPECIKLKKENKEKTRLLHKIKIQQEKEQRIINETLKKQKQCIECGNIFISRHGRQKLCSAECKNKHNNRIKEINRRHKLKENGKIDYSITLSKLIKRDKGICYICGGKVDLNVDINHDDYPSIDHVIPVSKGGTHTWDNVRLVHRKCNIIKSNKTFIEGKNGQLRIAI